MSINKVQAIPNDNFMFPKNPTTPVVGFLPLIN